MIKNIKYLFVGFTFGVILIKAEVISWFRIYEMFRFQSFHMYGIILSAIVTAMIGLFIIKKLKIKSIEGEKIEVVKKPFDKGTIIGGLIFGFGWALTGACPGPIYALAGSGITVYFVVLASAVLGTFIYGMLKDRLPH